MYPLRCAPSRRTKGTPVIIKKRSKLNLQNPSPNPFPQNTQLARQWIYSEFGERAFAAGQRAVYLGSKPYQAWLSFRGKDGMPGFVDRAIINGKVQEIVWMPSFYPPRRRQTNPKGMGDGQISRGLSLRTGGPGSYAKN